MMCRKEEQLLKEYPHLISEGWETVFEEYDRQYLKS